MKSGAELIADERARQIAHEGYTADHDDELPSCDLAVAGACYALDIAGLYSGQDPSWQGQYSHAACQLWPWDAEYWKPVRNDPVRELVKAGALIAAEIDCFQRQA